MTETLFKLESFSATLSDLPELTRRDALDSAYRDGLAEGRAMGFSEELRALTEAIRSLERLLVDAGAIRAEAERQAVADLLPILTEIVAALAGQPESAGIEAALRDELAWLAGQTATPGWHILSPPGMEPMIRRCAKAAGVEEPDIRLVAATDEASIIIDQGRSAFSKQRVAQHFRDLISELHEDQR